MTLVPIPTHELKHNIWYYGVRCTCARHLALCEDLFEGRDDDKHLDFPVPVEVECECGVVTRAQRLQKFKTPRSGRAR
jgi:hypothetical protein